MNAILEQTLPATSAKTVESTIHNFSLLLNAAVFSDAEGRLLDPETFASAVHAELAKVRDKDQMLFLVGNGGSAAIASHIRTDCVNACGLRAVTLHESSVMTCYANDYGYDNAFARQFQAMARRGDMLVAISSSGRSPNILNVVDTALEMGCPVLTLSGFSAANPLRMRGDLNAWLNSDDYGPVEVGHLFLLHHWVRSLP